MFEDIPVLPIWILGIPWLLGCVELLRTARSLSKETTRTEEVRPALS
jgi:hypothetical protein